MGGVDSDGDYSTSVSCLLQSLIAHSLGVSASSAHKKAMQRWSYAVLLGYGEEDLPDIQQENRAVANKAALLKACVHMKERRKRSAHQVVDLIHQLSRCSSVLGPIADGDYGSMAPCVQTLMEHEALLSLLLSLEGSVARPKLQELPLISPLPMYSLAPDVDLEPPTPPSIDHSQHRSALRSEETTPRTAYFSQPPSADLLFLERLRGDNQEGLDVGRLQPGAIGDDCKKGALLQRMCARPAWQPDLLGQAVDAAKHERVLPEQLQMLMMDEEPTYSTVFYSTPESEQPDILRESVEKARSSSSSLKLPRQSSARPILADRDSSQRPSDLDVEPIIAHEALLAAQGVLSAVHRLRQLQQPGFGRGSVARLLSELTAAGQLRANLDAFLAVFTVGARDRSATDPVRQALASEVQRSLREHNLALQSLPAAVLARRHEEQRQFPGNSSANMVVHTSPTLLEVAAHTRRIREELQILATICWCHPADATHNDGTGPLKWQSEAFPRGVTLLDHLYSSLDLGFTDTAATQLLQRVFLASLRPFAAQIRESLHKGLELGEAGLPKFLQGNSLELERAGQQLTILRQLGALTQPLLDHIARSVASEEAAVVAIIAPAGGEGCPLDLRPLEIRGLLPPVASSGVLFGPDTPPGLLLTFSAAKLQQVADLQQKAAADRMVKAGRLLDSLARQALQIQGQSPHADDTVAAPVSDAGLPGSDAMNALQVPEASLPVTDFRAPEAASTPATSDASFDVNATNSIAKVNRDERSSVSSQQQKVERPPAGLTTNQSRSQSGLQQPTAESGIDTETLRPAAGLASNGRVSRDQSGLQQTTAESGSAAETWRLAAGLPSNDRLFAGEQLKAWAGLAAQGSLPTCKESAQVQPAATSEHAVQQPRGTGDDIVSASSRDERGLLWGDLGREALPGMPASAAEASFMAARTAGLEAADVCDDAPVSVVVDVCLIQPIRAHYAFVSVICLRLFREQLQLKELLHALQRYFFLEAGDFGHNLVAALCAHAASLRPLRGHDLQHMLEDSIKASSIEADAFAGRLQGRLRCQAVPVGAEHVVMLREQYLGAFDAVKLGMEVPWPLSLVVTEEAMDTYSEVFSSLLQLQRVGFVVSSLWSLLVPRRASRDPKECAPNTGLQGRLLKAQMMRFQAGQLTAALQAFNQGQLLGAPWTALLASLQSGARDLMELREALYAYLAECRAACLLTAETAHLRQRTSVALQAVLDFQARLSAHPAGSTDAAAALLDDALWDALQQPMQIFRCEVEALHAMLKAEPPQSPLAALYTQLNMSTLDDGAAQDEESYPL